LKHVALELDEDLLANATGYSENKLTRARFFWKKHGNEARRMGRTPMDAVKERAGRKIVETLVAQPRRHRRFFPNSRP
jgi:hypothetical protein